MKKEADIQRWLSLKDACFYTGMGRTTMRKFIAMGIIKYSNPFHHFGQNKKGKKLLDRLELDKLMGDAEIETTDIRTI